MRAMPPERLAEIRRRQPSPHPATPDGYCPYCVIAELLDALDAALDAALDRRSDADDIIGAYDRALRALDDGGNDLPTRVLEARYRAARAALEAALISAGRRPK